MESLFFCVISQRTGLTAISCSGMSNVSQDRDGSKTNLWVKGVWAFFVVFLKHRSPFSCMHVAQHIPCVQPCQCVHEHSCCLVCACPRAERHTGESHFRLGFAGTLLSLAASRSDNHLFCPRYYLASPSHHFLQTSFSLL